MGRCGDGAWPTTRRASAHSSGEVRERVARRPPETDVAPVRGAVLRVRLRVRAPERRHVDQGLGLAGVGSHVVDDHVDERLQVVAIDAHRGRRVDDDAASTTTTTITISSH